MSDERAPDPGSPPSILRRASSQQRQSTRSPTLGQPSPARRQSTQDRINEILETGRERATTMGNTSWSSGRSPKFRPLPQAAEQEDGADERTGIVGRGNVRDYQSTQVNSQHTAAHQSPARASPTPAPATNGDASHHEETHSEEEDGWKGYLSSMWSIELENKGSVARDHLALERTFLAWLRTSLAFASIGIAVTQLFRLNTSLANAPDDASFQTIRHLGKPLGACFLGISILVLFLGYQRYVQSQQWVMKGKFPASRGTIVLVTLIAFALMVVSLIVVVVIQPAGSGD